MNKIFLSLALVLLLSFSLAQNIDGPIEIVLHNLPDYLRVSGKAQGEVPNEQVKIGITIETLKQQASDSLQQNSDNSTRAIAKLQLLGLESSEFATSGISIFPSYNQVYNSEKNTYTQVFEGYKVRNIITITTRKLKLVGKIIDAAVSNGVNNVDYVNYSPLDSTVSALKEQLLVSATKNASKQANIVLSAVGYEVKSVKSLNIVNNNYNPVPYLEFASKASDEGISTPTFKGSSTVSVQVDVSFIIGLID